MPSASPRSTFFILCLIESIMLHFPGAAGKVLFMHLRVTCFHAVIKVVSRVRNESAALKTKHNRVKPGPC